MTKKEIYESNNTDRKIAKTVYIQANHMQPYNHEGDCIKRYCLDNEIRYELLNYHQLITGKYDELIKTNLFVGTAEFMKEVFNRVGLTNVKLPINSNRESRIITLDEVRVEISPIKSLFIKPVDIKLFTGFILDESHYTCLDNIPGDTKLYVYDPFEYEIISEWRVYIHNNKLVDLKNYSGDFSVFPDVDYITNVMIQNQITSAYIFPDTYCIDIGINEYGDNMVIEFNDMWSIGNYGVDNELYFKMIKGRYFTIIKQKL